MRSSESSFFFSYATLVLRRLAQPVPSPDAVRVTISLNADGSRTTYQFDDANHKAIATTTNREGKSLGKTHYTLDDSGRFATGDGLRSGQTIAFQINLQI